MPSPKNKDFYWLLGKIEDSLEKGLPFSVYRKPLQTEVTGIFQANVDLNYVADFKESGFVFAPFDFKDNAILIQPDEIVAASYHSATEKLKSTTTLSDTGKEEHLRLIQKGIDAIQEGTLKKVVLSRKIEVKKSRSTNEIFEHLLKNYPNAFCYLFFHPKTGLWCGATPETLVEIKGKELHTMSLAATLPVDPNTKPQWGNKEIEEQQLVSDHIGDRLQGKMEQLKIDAAESVKAGSLWHLRSQITGKISDHTTFNEIITALHPTPAVCGIPTENAKAFIKTNENYQRTFYTGFLGELNLQNKEEISLFVNLRCMEIHKKVVSIFVGGGITSASIPESEWIETQNKSKTMLHVL